MREIDRFSFIQYLLNYNNIFFINKFIRVKYFIN